MNEQERTPVPTFRYRSDGAGGIEKRLFDHPDDIPGGERWTDSPARVNCAPEASDISVAADGLSPPYDVHKFHKLRLELQRRTGKGTRPGTTKVQLVAMLKKLDQ